MKCRGIWKREISAKRELLILADPAFDGVLSAKCYRDFARMRALRGTYFPQNSAVESHRESRVGASEIHRTRPECRNSGVNYVSGAFRDNLVQGQGESNPRNDLEWPDPRRRPKAVLGPFRNVVSQFARCDSLKVLRELNPRCKKTTSMMQ